LNKKKNAIHESLVEAFQAIAPFASVGWVFAVSVAVCTALGWWIDTRIGTKPYFLLGGAVFGIIIGIYNLAVVVKELNEESKKKTEAENNSEKTPHT
jgi:F0F1-type ATP synthase assembly protein I